MTRTLSWALALGAIAVLSGCDDTAAPSDNRAELAEEHLMEAMRTDDYAAAPDVVGDLWIVRDSTPENEHNTFLLGTANLWWLAEAGRPGTNGLVVITRALPMVLETFSDALQNGKPENLAMTEAFLGTFLVDTGFDRINGSKLVEQSMRVPETGLFARMAIRRMAFADDSLTTNAIEAGYQFWDSCIDGHIDRDNPDYTKYMKPVTADSRKRFCFGSPKVPYGMSGAWMIFGDMLVKGGRLNAARRAYLNAKLSPTYDKWKHKSGIEARLNSDLAARAATYNSRDATKWAPIGDEPYACTQCHAELP